MSRASEAAIIRMRQYLADPATQETEEEEREFRVSKARVMHEAELRRHPPSLQLDLQEAA
ncbi:hypothetical protein [Solilutibacter silvestris]|uniref:hypothetical protein n=1 Tax=Solilutibacter silvestris TaxID=1645665 RepID=UPI003D32CF9B